MFLFVHVFYFTVLCVADELLRDALLGQAEESIHWGIASPTEHSEMFILLPSSDDG